MHTGSHPAPQRRALLRLSLSALLGLPALLRPGAAAASGAPVSLGGSGAALPVFDLIGSAWGGAYPAFANALRRLPEASSEAAAADAVLEGQLDVALLHRPPTEVEAARGLRAVAYARSPLAIVTGLDTPAQGLSAAQLGAILEGRLRRWGDGTPITVIWRRPPAADLRALAALSPAVARALVQVESVHGATPALTEGGLATAVEGQRGALGFVMLGQVLAEGRSLRALSLDGVECSAAELGTGRYPLSRPLYWVARGQARPEAQALLEFVQDTRMGGAVLGAHGHLPLRMG